MKHHIYQYSAEYRSAKKYERNIFFIRWIPWYVLCIEILDYGGSRKLWRDELYKIMETNLR